MKIKVKGMNQSNFVIDRNIETIIKGSNDRTHKVLKTLMTMERGSLFKLENKSLPSFTMRKRSALPFLLSILMTFLRDSDRGFTCHTLALER
jgi:hypothetical protein